MEEMILRVGSGARKPHSSSREKPLSVSDRLDELG